MAEYCHCEAALAAVGCMRQPHPGRCSVWAPRAKARVSQSAGRGAYVAYELSETTGCGARSNHAHSAVACRGFLREVCFERFFVLAIRVTLREIPAVILVQVSRDAGG